ncbi:MAG TPA: Chromate resistance protein ChrB [Acidimicrobiales bacterium]|nr:Chromate resistance protein ChrB [Acidimicrobiales bacterium]
MGRQGEWVLLAYRLPREPSTPRVTVWRQLARLGVAQLLDGLVALPADARTREQLEWLADEVIEAGGEATVWLGRPGSARQERTLAARMAETVTADYRAVAADAADARRDTDGAARRRTLARLRRELRRIERRDFFPPPDRERARRAIDALADDIATTVEGRAR